MSSSASKILLLAPSLGAWSVLDASPVLVLSLKDAKMKLLDGDFNALVIDILGANELNELVAFIDNVRNHPRINSLLIFLSSNVLLQKQEKEVLLTKYVKFISGPSDLSQYLSTAKVESSVKSSQAEETFQSVFTFLHEMSAKSLARIKIEEQNAPYGKGLIDKSKLIERYLEILKEELG